MTAHYTRMTDQTIRRRWEQATKVNIRGERGDTVRIANPQLGAMIIYRAQDNQRLAGEEQGVAGRRPTAATLLA